MGIIGKLFTKTNFGRKYVSDRILKKADVCFVSFPKTGRTWLRVMLIRYLQLYYNLPLDTTILDPMGLKINGPKILFIHSDGNPLNRKPNQLTKIKSEYFDKKIVLMIREPKDTMVSAYFHKIKRTDSGNAFKDSISEYIKSETGGLLTFLYFYKYWYEQKNQVKDFHLIRYEDVYGNTEIELKKLLTFLGIGVDDKKIKTAVDFASFNTMHKLEKNNQFNNEILKPTDKNDPSTFKTREGKVDGYVKYLDVDDIDYINKQTRKYLPSAFGYTS